MGLVLCGALPEGRDLLLELGGRGPGRYGGFCLVVCLQLVQVRRHLRVDLREQDTQLARAEVTVLGVLRPELAAVDGHQFAAEKVELPTEQGELAAHPFEGQSVILAEVGDGLEVGLEPTQQPDHFQVAAASASRRREERTRFR